MIKLEELENIVKNTVSEKRYLHCISTKKQCELLAKIYKVDEQKAMLVGLAHDIAKEMTEEESMQYVMENNIAIDEIEEKVPSLLHAKIGADIAKKRFRFSEDMANAIEAHTTGKVNMDILAKILFVADVTGDDRKEEKDDIMYVRELAKNNIDDAVIYLLNSIIKGKIENNRMLHLDGILTRNELLNKKIYK